MTLDYGILIFFFLLFVSTVVQLVFICHGLEPGASQFRPFDDRILQQTATVFSKNVSEVKTEIIPAADGFSESIVKVTHYSH